MVVVSNFNSNNLAFETSEKLGQERVSYNPANYYLSLYEKQEEAIKDGGQLVTLRYPDGGTIQISTTDPSYDFHKQQIETLEYYNTTASLGENSTVHEMEIAKTIFGDNNIPDEIKSRIANSALRDDTISLSTLNSSDLYNVIGQTGAYRNLSNEISSLQKELENHPAFFSMSKEQLAEMKSEFNLGPSFNFSDKDLSNLAVGDLRSILNSLDKLSKDT